MHQLTALPGFEVTSVVRATNTYSIYRAVRQEDQRPVVIKVLADRNTDPLEIERLRHEVDISVGLNGEHVIPWEQLEQAGPYRVLVAPDKAYVPIETPTLADVVDICNAVADLHECSLMHLGLGPVQYLRDPETHDVIFEDLRTTRSMVNNRVDRSAMQRERHRLPYLAPELSGRTDQQVDHRADLYALGISFFEWMTGQHPFVATTPIEWIHAHLAIVPPSASDLARDLPDGVGKIIDRLLSKDPSDRYMTARAVAQDLERCIRGERVVEEDGGRRFFQIPSTLYGRDGDLQQLRSFFGTISARQSSAGLFISGYSGIGKTSLIMESISELVAERGFFNRGKYDQLNRNVPYQGWLQAFSGWAKQILAEDDATIQHWRDHLIDVLGANIQLMCEAIPPIELLVGTHERPGSLPSVEEANRFVFTFERLITAISSAEHPVVLFLDDLQWADVASLQLLERVLLSEKATCLAVVGAYRDNEVDALHPLSAVMKRLNGRVVIEHLHLDRLSEESIVEMVADTLRTPANDVRDLADYLSNQTEGNPLFLTQSLSYWHDIGLITYNEESRVWSYNIQEIRTAGIPDNVVDLVVANIRRLPEDAQVALQIAACIGNEFALGDLRIITTAEQRKALLVAVESGLIRSIRDNYLLLVAPDLDAAGQEVRFRFLHDRVQQAAHSMLPEDEKNRIHVQLGWSQYERSQTDRSEDSVFVIAGHLNHGHDLITDPHRRAIAAGINLEAGIQARSATAYDQAVAYIEAGIHLLPDESRRLHDDLWYHLQREYGHALYLRGDTERAAHVLTQLLNTKRTRLEKLRILQIVADMFSNLNEHERVIDTLDQAMALFSVSMPRKPLAAKMAVLRGIVEMKLRTRGRNIRSMANDAVSDDPEMIALLDLVMATGPSAYVYSQDIFAWLVLFQALQSRKHGNMPNSALGYAGYGMILSTAFGDVASAIEYLELAEAINERFGTLSIRHKVGFIRCHFLGHFRDPVPKLLEHAAEVYHHSLEAGDPLYAGFCLDDILWYEAGIGKNLGEICKNADVAMRVLEKIKNINGHDLFSLRLQPLRVLAGLPLLPWSIGDPDQTWEERIEADRRSKASAHVAIDCLYHLQVGYLLGPSIDNDDVITVGHAYHSFLVGTYLYADIALYLCLVLYTVHGDNAPRPIQKMYRVHQKLMHTRRKECPANYQHHAGIIDAVALLMKRRTADAQTLIVNTVAIAEREGFTNIVGIGNELLGQLALQQHKHADAGRYLKTALQAFERWGAIAKVRQLQERYPDILLTHTTSAPSGIEEDIDLSSLMKSAVAISGEIRIDKLLPSLISIVVENAGAQFGQLYLHDEERFVLGASTTTDDVSPVSIVQYVRNTRETLVLNLPARDERFRSDKYIQQRNPKSVLCLPIVHQGALKGVIYLENNLFVNAFTEQRISTMQILSAQIAVSLDNALLYKNLSHALETQVQLTEAYSRFTPKEYLKFLGRTSILDVRLGDHRSETMTVLFSDIRSYTSLAEELTAEDNFQFLSSYLRKMSEVVTRHNGLVNQLLGDGLLAFFWNSADAVNAAVDMQIALEEYNIQRLQKGRRPVSAGIGLHKGTVIIGIVGDATRMDASILSDTVNAASRIEGLTKHYQTKILMSESVVDDLGAHHRDLIRFIGKVQVKGKREAMGIHECFASDRREIKALKVQQHAAFSNAMSLYVDGAFSQAAEEFQSLINAEIEPDHVVHELHERSRHYLHHGTPEHWDGVEQITVK